MTSRDHRDIQSLFFIHRFIPASIARLYGLSRQRIGILIHDELNITIISDTTCLLCGLDDAKTFYIDGNEENKDPQNIIMLCEADIRRIQHLQLRRKEGIAKSQF